MNAGISPFGPSCRIRHIRLVLLCCGALWAVQSASRADEGVITAVSSQVSPNYSRARLADGSFAPETYSFGVGGRMTGMMRDDSIDKLDFMKLARMVAVPLAGRNFIPSPNKDPKETKLLIMVYWGKTNGTETSSASLEFLNLQDAQLALPTPQPMQTSNLKTGPSAVDSDNSKMLDAARQDSYMGALQAVSAENNMRDLMDSRNAAILGYDSELAATNGLEMTAFRTRRNDILAEIEENRYFVVLMAYDFQAMWKQKKHVLLWATRMSVRERGTNFSNVLPVMVQYSSQYFGEDTHGLLRKPLPEAHVEMGEVESLGVVPEK
jgi:hypothetical protein